MVKKKDNAKQSLPTQDIKLRFAIKPAFVVEIVDDSTGKKWSGHYTFGRTAREAMRRWRTALKTKGNEPYASANLTFSAEDASMIDGISWERIITKKEYE